MDRRSGLPIAAEAVIKVFPNRFMFELDTWLRQGGAELAVARLPRVGTDPSAGRLVRTVHVLRGRA
jgi:hypothetical protein